MASGALLKLIPTWPASRHRATSVRVASRSQNGTAVIASSRSGAAEQNSVWKSLKACTHASASSWSSSRAQYPPPKPPTFGYRICAQMPWASMNSTRASACHAAGGMSS
jgi:hypothetical protein